MEKLKTRPRVRNLPQRRNPDYLGPLKEGVLLERLSVLADKLVQGHYTAQDLAEVEEINSRIQSSLLTGTNVPMPQRLGAFYDLQGNPFSATFSENRVFIRYKGQDSPSTSLSTTDWNFKLNAREATPITLLHGSQHLSAEAI